MSNRFGQFPQQTKTLSPYEFKFKKSPLKPISPLSSPEPPPKPHETYSSQFDNLKKIDYETSLLRQTMNGDISKRLMGSTYSPYEHQKPAKFNDFLRQTMDQRAIRSYGDSFIGDSNNSKQVCMRAERFTSTSTNFAGRHFPVPSSNRSTLQVFDASNEEGERLKEKMDNMKKQLEELKKTKQKRSDLLYKVNTHRSPTYIQLDQDKQSIGKSIPLSPTYTPRSEKVEHQFKSTPYIPLSDTKPQIKSEKHKYTNSLTTISSPKRQSSISQSNIVNDFVMGRKLGEGKFGCVYFAQHKTIGGVYAIKKIPKSMIKSHMMIDQLALQIRLQICLHHNNVLGMYGFFDDATHLYIVLEYMDGGTLYSKLKKTNQLEEQEAAYIIKQITTALEYLHDLGIAHRDLKPQNIVISNDIYKLCDFGWAAKCDNRRMTYCGTFDYAAPEILQGVEYDMTVDLWCLGVLTFQLLTGRAPFYHISRKETMKKILNVQNDNLQYPETMSQEAKDFIEQLLQKNPNKRMKALQALQHPFIKDAEWE